MDLIGFESTMAMLKRWGGAAIYLPTVTHAFRDIRDQKIREGFDGANYLELARRYNLTVSHVRKILNEGMSCER
jgi:Mor family transcriptional regulator